MRPNVEATPPQKTISVFYNEQMPEESPRCHRASDQGAESPLDLSRTDSGLHNVPQAQEVEGMEVFSKSLDSLWTSIMGKIQTHYFKDDTLETRITISMHILLQYSTIN